MTAQTVESINEWQTFQDFFHTISSFNPEKGTQMETHYLRISKISLFVIL